MYWTEGSFSYVQFSYLKKWFGIFFDENKKKFPPARLYFGLHIYYFFQKIFLPARLLCPARLMFFKNFPTSTFFSSYTSIRYTRVGIFYTKWQQQQQQKGWHNQLKMAKKYF